MRTAALGEVARIVSGATPKTRIREYWNGEVPWVTPADLSKLDGAYISSTSRKLTSVGVQSCGTAVLPAGSVLLSSRAPIGHVAINTVPMATNQGFKSLVPGQHVDAKYLFYWLKSRTVYLQSLGNGATFKELSKKTAENIEIPLPSLDDQRRIAAILDRADALRTKRRQVIADLDLLALAAFRMSFPKDPGNLRALGDVANLHGGASLPAGDRYRGQVGGALLMKVSDMNSPGNEERITSTALWTSHETSRASTVDGGAVVLPKRGASIATNKKRLTTRTTALDPNLMGISPQSGHLNSRYLHAWLKSFDLTTITSGSTVPQLNKQDLAPLLIPVPPIGLQEEFDERLGVIDTHRAAMVRSAHYGDNLFASLQARAFRGEL